MRIPLGILHASSMHARQALLTRKRNMQIRVTGLVAILLTIAVIIQYGSIISANHRKPLLATTRFASISKSAAAHPSISSRNDLQSPLGKAFILAHPVPFYQLDGSEGGITKTLDQKQPTGGTGLIGILSRKTDRNPRLALEPRGN